MNQIKIVPSILSADFSRLGEEVINMEKAGADMLHLDVMDGHFVNNISFGMPVIKSIRDKTNLVFDVHLIIEHPQKFVKPIAELGVEHITFYLSSKDDIQSTITMIKDLGVDVGISIAPKDDVYDVLPYLEQLNSVLVMTVEPDYGGQAFQADMCKKISVLRDECNKKNLGNVSIGVDGGISDKTISLAVKAGATYFVAGSYLFGKDHYKQKIDMLKNIAANTISCNNI